MKTSFLHVYNIFKVTAISMLFLLAGLFQFQNVYGAGSPKVSTPSPQELRRKANIHFDKGESFRMQEKFIADTKAGKKTDSKW